MKRVLGSTYQTILVEGFVALFLVLVLALAPAAPASAVAAIPPVDEAFRGNITVNGYEVPAGKLVVAKVGVEERGSITTQYPGKYGSDEEGNFGPGIKMLAVSGTTGTIYFYLGTTKASQTGTFPDSRGITELNLTFAPTPPVAAAGSDRTAEDTDGNGVETIVLDGSGSYDPDLNVTGWEWREGSTVLGTGAVFSGSFAVGTHTVTLKVTDTTGLPDTDDVVVTVNEVQQPEEPPVTPPEEPPVTPPPETPSTPPSNDGTPVVEPTTPTDETPSTPADETPSTPSSPNQPSTPASTDDGQGGGMNWWLWAISMIAAIMVAMLLTFLIVRRKAPQSR